MTTIPNIITAANTIIIKIGTALIIKPDGTGVRTDWLEQFAKDAYALKAQNKRILIVSSGAVAMGRTALNIALDAPPSSIPLERKQAASAIGQFHVFNGYHKAFQTQNITLAQVLLTMSETENRRMHLNARATLAELMDHGIIPIVNENDTISTGELRFGDNDRLAARVGQMINADCVLLMSTIDGLYTDNPEKTPDATHVPIIEKITAEHTKMAGEAIPGLSTGGMKSKLEAAKAATISGMNLIISDGCKNGSLHLICNNEQTRSTLFKAETTSKTARKRWIGAHLSPKGTITIDNGAIKALKSGKSLLPIGVTNIKGTFERGDIIEIQSEQGVRIALGISAYSALNAQSIKGQSSQNIPKILGYLTRPELVHRNDMVLSE